MDKMNRLYKNSLMLLCAAIMGVLLLYYVPALYRSIQTKEMPEQLARWNWQRTETGRAAGENGTGERITEEITLPHTFVQEEGNFLISIDTVLPQKMQEESYLMFWTYFQTVHIYVEDQLIYVWDREMDVSIGEAAASIWNKVEMSSDFAGKTLRIEMDTPYSGCRFVLENIMLGTDAQLHSWLNREYFIERIADVIVLILAAFSAVLTMMQPEKWEDKACHFYFSLAAMLLSIWLIVGLVGLPLDWMNNYCRQLLAYTSFFLLPIPCTLSFYYTSIHKEFTGKKYMGFVCKILLLLELLTVFTVLILQAFQIKNIYELAFAGQTMILAAMVYGAVKYMLLCGRYKKHLFFIPFLCGCLLLLATLLEYAQYFFNFTKDFKEGTFIRFCVLGLLLVEFFFYFIYTQKKLKEEQKILEENKNLQIQLFNSQIRPHFILNTLGAIRALIQPDPELAQEALYDFLKYIRSNIEPRDYFRMAPFTEELEYINTYLKLEKLRFGEKLQIEYQIGVRDFRMLLLTIQPFVENAVKHGILPLKHPGKVVIATKRQKQGVLVEIRDNGVGFSVEKWKKEGADSSLGIKNAMSRLKVEMKAKVSISSSQEEGKSGTVVKIWIP